MALSPDILGALNPPQHQAVTHHEGPLLILAGAGSGKTRVITCRIAHLLSEGVSPWNILAVTFTNKAAAEMRQRVDALAGSASRGTWISTFHAFGAQFMRVEAKALGLDPNFTIYDSDDQAQVVKECLRELNLDEKKYKPNLVIGVIGRAKDELLDADSYNIHNIARSDDPFHQMAGAVYARYQKKLAKANALDFGDLIMRPVMGLRDNEALRAKYQARFRHILVDEYQDTNHAQYLLAKYMIPAPKNLCVVGDDDQSIYSWRGADIRNIMEFERDYPGAVVVKLEQNYRSTREILTAAHSVIKRNRFRKEKKLWTDKSGGAPVRFVEFADELEEARFVASETAAGVRAGTITPKDVAVFYRTNAQSRVLEDSFRRENIPYQLIGSQRFYERMEVKDVLAYLRVALNPADGVSVKRIINVPARGLGKATIQLLDDHANATGLTLLDAVSQAPRIPLLTPAARGNLMKFVDVLRPLQAQAETLPAAQMVQLVLENTGYWQFWQEQTSSDPEAAARLDNLQELVNAAKEFEEAEDQGAGPGAGGEAKSVRAFLERVSLSSGLDGVKDGSGAVTLMTVHLAKGLEFPSVYVTGLEEGLFPIGESAFDEMELEEERRLAYVAITRAREKLVLTAAASRKIYGRSHWNVPSRFVAEAGLRPEAPPAADPASFGGWGGRRAEPKPTRPPETTGSIASFDPDEAETPVNAPPGSPRPLKVGQRVRHPMFGPGKILNKTGTGENVKVTVLFDAGPRKDILARYANFEVL